MFPRFTKLSEILCLAAAPLASLKTKSRPRRPCISPAPNCLAGFQPMSLYTRE